MSRPPRWAFRYDLRLDIASFDFYSSLVMAAAKGAVEVVFGIERPKENKWTAAAVMRRFETIIKPGPALLGLPHRIGSDGIRPHSPHMRTLVEFYRAGNDFPRLKSVLPKGSARYTVTLRRDPRIPARNSNEPAWREFARLIGALVIEDYDVAPLDLHDRMALYAGAEMNFGVPNGPMHLCVVSDCPYMMFDCQNSDGAYASCGMALGAQYPWARPDQIAIWEPDDIDVLRKHFELWKSGTSAGGQ